MQWLSHIPIGDRKNELYEIKENSSHDLYSCDSICLLTEVDYHVATESTTFMWYSP